MKDKQTILLVDDMVENIDVLVSLLGEHDLVTALDAQTALITIEEEKIDLILLDIMMPEMDGFEMCEILKKDSKYSHIPIIFLSAKDKYEDISKGLELGAVDYITKPFNPSELLARVHTHLKLRAYEQDLELRVQEELEKNRAKQQMIHQQSKQAALGELLMHIAHQWKQPLASLGSIILLNKAKQEMGIMPTKEELADSLDKSEELISYMSETIDTFKDFYQPSYESEEFFIHESFINVLSIVEATFNFDKIKIYVNSHEETPTFANMNEFSQIIFSILNNSRDVFKIRDIKDPQIHIEIENQRVSIEDNAGGIPEDMLEDIFLPFVSTKGSSGIGLYLSKTIAEKNNAVLTVENTERGAKFTLEFITWID